MLVDSHCHLDCLDLQTRSLADVLQQAAAADVNYFLCPGVDIEHAANVLAIAKQYSNVVAAIGKHPTETGHNPSVAELVTLGNDKIVVGIGETGLDYAGCETEAAKEQQRQLFRVHIQAAKELHKPLIIHSREAAQDILTILREEQAATVGGVLHCFTEDLAMAQAAMDLNFYISLSGIITFKKADSLRAVAMELPLDKILIETDAPYLAPVPMRGKPNEPAYLRYIAEFLAKLRGIAYQQLAEQTTANFFRLFGRC